MLCVIRGPPVFLSASNRKLQWRVFEDSLWPAESKLLSEDWCAWQDLNLHALRHYHLKVACLPIPPHAQARIMKQRSKNFARQFLHCADDAG